MTPATPINLLRVPQRLARLRVRGTLIVVCLTASPFAASAQDLAVALTAVPTGISAVSIPGAEGSISRVAVGAGTIHVILGHSVFLNTKSRLRRVYIADPAILNSITLTPNRIIVTAMNPGVSSLILLDEAGQAQSYVVSSDVDVQGLRTAIDDAVHSEEVNVEASGDRIILSGKVATEALADTAVKLAGLYTKDVANSLTITPEHPKQVRLKVRILEVDRSKINQFGINLFNPGGNTSFLASTTTSQFPSTATLSQSTSGNTSFGTLTTTNPLNFLLYSTKLNLGATVQDLESKQVLQILAEPTITTISGQKANFLAGGEFPFPVIQPGGGSASNASVTIQFRPYGVKLEFTPTVNDDGTIRLKVAPEVSALDYTNSVNISGYTIPALSTRKAETEVELRSDQSFAISGLLDQRTTDAFSKTPGAASIPIIGALFKSKNINHATTELIVIVTPTLVDPLADGVSPAEPKLAVPTLNTGSFDKSLGKSRNTQPTLPLDPSQPASANHPPRSAPSPAAAVAGEPPPAPAAVAPVPDTPPPSIPTQPLAVTVPESAGSSVAQAASPVEAQPAPAAAAPAPPPAEVLAAANAPPPIAPPPAAARQLVSDEPAAAAPAAAMEPPASIRAMVQVMTLSHREDAEAMVGALKRLGYKVAVSQDSKDTLLHLEVGPFSSKVDAEAIRQKLLDDGYNATLR